ncbi:MAG: NAD-dependent epimerase/dehydratase family protein, partial [Bacillota bacterium]|nr:NAD-dependent epimerase/dehydratase family protein [Bacillota bacterium]
MKEQFKVPESKTCLVTGVAGFIGSHLAHRLLDEGCRVIGVDCFTDYYDHKIKEKNIIDLMERPDFEIIRADITELDQSILDDVQWIFHQAAQAGVRASWGEEFADYTHHNI